MCGPVFPAAYSEMKEKKGKLREELTSKKETRFDLGNSESIILQKILKLRHSLLGKSIILQKILKLGHSLLGKHVLEKKIAYSRIKHGRWKLSCSKTASQKKP